MGFLSWARAKLIEQKDEAFASHPAERTGYAKQLASDVRDLFRTPTQNFNEKGEPCKTFYYGRLMYDGMGISRTERRTKVPLNKCSPIYKNGKKFFRSEVLRALPIPVKGDKRYNSSAIYLGRAPIKIGNRPPKWDIPATYFREALILDHLDGVDCVEKSSEYISKNTNNFMARGSFQTVLTHLRGLALHKKRLRSDGNLVRVIDYINELNLPDWSLPLPSDVHLCPMRIEAGNGGDFSALGSKAKAASTIYEAAEKLLRLISREPTPDLSFYTIGAREKRNIEIEDGEFLEARAVINQDSVECAAAKPFTALLESFFAEDRGRTNPIFIGTSFSHYGYMRFAEKVVNSHLSKDDDVKGFDEGIYKELFLIAFSIIRSCFRKGKDVDNIFYHFLYGVVYKRIVTPDGLMYLFQEGFPSGTAWTSILGSVINWIMLKDTMLEYSRRYWDNKMPSTSFSIYGDDFVVHINECVRFEMSEFGEIYESRHGLKLKGKSAEGETISSEEGKSVSFLKINLSDDITPYTRSKDILERVMLPVRKIKGANDFLSYVFDQMRCCPLSQQSLELVSSLAASIGTVSKFGFSKSDNEEGRTYFNNRKKYFKRITKNFCRRIFIYRKIDPLLIKPKLFINRRGYYSPMEVEKAKISYQQECDQTLLDCWFWYNFSRRQRIREPSLGAKTTYLELMIGKAVCRHRSNKGVNPLYKESGDRLTRLDYYWKGT